MAYFQTQKSKFGKISEGLRIDNVGIFYDGHLQYFTAIWHIIRPSGNVVVIWYIFPHFWYIGSGKIWQP
jgi:hypothetical protein